MDLREWLTNYLKWKDQAEHTLKEIKVENDELTAVYEDRKATYIFADKLNEDILKRLREGKHRGVVIKNVEENLSFLVKEWNTLTSIPNLMMIFVNVELGEKWILFPATHNMIADRETLKQGLRTMFDLANGKVPEIKKEKKKQMFEDVPEEDDE
jgi:hypothetical protein